MSERAPASRDDLVGVAELARRLGVAEAAAREWAEQWGLLRALPGLPEARGRKWVRWGDVLDLHTAPKVKSRKARATVGDDPYVDPES